MDYSNYTTFQRENTDLQRACIVVKRAKQAHEKACRLLKQLSDRTENGSLNGEQAEQKMAAAKDKLARTAIELEEARRLLSILNTVS